MCLSCCVLSMCCNQRTALQTEDLGGVMPCCKTVFFKLEDLCCFRWLLWSCNFFFTSIEPDCPCFCCAAKEAKDGLDTGQQVICPDLCRLCVFPSWTYCDDLYWSVHNFGFGLLFAALLYPHWASRSIPFLYYRMVVNWSGKKVYNCTFPFEIMNILDKEREDVAFDILYSGDSSVIHRPLRERQHLLQKAIRPLKGRLELLLPESGGLNAHRPSGKQSFLSCFIFFDVTWFRN